MSIKRRSPFSRPDGMEVSRLPDSFSDRGVPIVPMTLSPKRIVPKFLRTGRCAKCGKAIYPHFKICYLHYLEAGGRP